MTAAPHAPRTRIERVRAAAGIAALAVRQIEDDVRADDVDQEELAAILRELIEDTDLPGGSNQPIRPGSANSRRPAPSRPGPTGRTSARTATSRSRAEAPAWPGRQINIL